MSPGLTSTAKRKGRVAYPRPLEKTETPAGLAGDVGAYRAPEADNRLGAHTDREAVAAWLEYHHSEQPTWINYRKEAERLLLWAWLVRGKELSSLDRTDMQAFAHFLEHPPKNWKGIPYHRTDSRWRPFKAGLTPAARAQAIRILRSLFSYLVEWGYLRTSPLSGTDRLSRGKAKAGTRRGAERHLSHRAFDYALASQAQAIEIAEGEREAAKLARERWIVLWLLYSGARRAETAQAMMSDIVRENKGWWWRVLGKGNKLATVPIPSEAIQALKAYRHSLGLEPLPSPADKLPLVVRLRRPGKDPDPNPVTPALIYTEVKRFFERASKQSKESKDEQIKGLAKVLEEASTHWLRHTAITRQVEAGIPLTHVQRNARHSRLDTTGQYIHAEDEARARSIERVHAETERQPDG